MSKSTLQWNWVLKARMRWLSLLSLSFIQQNDLELYLWIVGAVIFEGPAFGSIDVAAWLITLLDCDRISSSSTYKSGSFCRWLHVGPLLRSQTLTSDSAILWFSSLFSYLEKLFSNYWISLHPFYFISRKQSWLM